MRSTDLLLYFYCCHPSQCANDAYGSACLRVDANDASSFFWLFKWADKKKVGTKLEISEQLKNKAFHYKMLMLICCNYSSYFGACGGAVGWGIAPQAGGSQVLFLVVLLEYFIDLILRPHCVPGIDSASNRHGYQEYFLWGKGGRWEG